MVLTLRKVFNNFKNFSNSFLSWKKFFFLLKKYILVGKFRKKWSFNLDYYDKKYYTVEKFSFKKNLLNLYLVIWVKLTRRDYLWRFKNSAPRNISGKIRQLLTVDFFLYPTLSFISQVIWRKNDGFLYKSFHDLLYFFYIIFPRLFDRCMVAFPHEVTEAWVAFLRD